MLNYNGLLAIMLVGIFAAWGCSKSGQKSQVGDADGQQDSPLEAVEDVMMAGNVDQNNAPPLESSDTNLILTRPDSNSTDSESSGMNQLEAETKPAEVPVPPQVARTLIPLDTLDNEENTTQPPRRHSAAARQHVHLSLPAKADVHAVERLFKDLDRIAEPAEGLERIESFEQMYELSDLQLEQITELRSSWERFNEENRLRSGTEMLDGKSVRERRAKSREILAGVSQMCVERKPIDSILEEIRLATTDDPECIVGYYLSGLIKAIWLNDPKGASGDFRRVLRDIPDHAGALNNLGICEMKAGEHARALSNWRSALNGTQHVAHRETVIANAQRALALSKVGKLALRETLQRSIETFLDNEKSTIRATGWMYSPWIEREEYYQPAPAKPQVAQFLQRPREEPLTLTQTASALAVGGEYLLVPISSLQLPYLQECQTIRLVGEPGLAGPAEKAVEVIVTSSELGLAVLFCRDFYSPRIPFLQEELAEQLAIRRSTESASGNSQDRPAEFGSLELLPPTDSSNHPFIAVIESTDANLEGTSLFTEQGEVVGIVSPIVSKTGNQYTHQVWSASTIQAFLEAAGINLAAYPVSFTPQPSQNWDSIKNELQHHFIELRLYYPRANYGLEVAPRSPFNQSDYLADNTCMICSGRGRLSCDNKGCVKGRTSRTANVVTGRTPQGKPIFAVKVFHDPCRRCSATGFLRCQNCRGGVDN